MKQGKEHVSWVKVCLVAAVCVFIGLGEALIAGSTGKISGKVVDANSGEPLIGVNILLEETTMGAAADLEGNYAVLNVPPGIYTLRASAIGYNTVRVTNVRVQVDLTTNVDFQLAETTIEMKEEVVVVAQRPIVQKDLTSTSSRVSSDQIKTFPVEDVSGLVNLQAGVVEGHFRGGRGGEVLYMIDGISVTDAYSGGAGVTTENHSIQELEVISGTFNAEYGQAMSGVVNQVTKDGGEKYAGEISFYAGDYVSTRNDVFLGIDRINPGHVANIQGTLSGPVLPGVTFFISARKYYNEGHLYGKRIFLPKDSSDFSSNDPALHYVGASGDGALVPLSPEDRFTAHVKATIQLFTSDRLRLTYLDQRQDWREYDHAYKYNPDGTYQHRTRGKLAGVSYTTVFDPTSFLEIHGAWFSNLEESYVFEDPYDPRFPDYRRALAVSGPAFLTGGARDLHLHRESRYLSFKADFVSQVTKEHQIKLGVEGKKHRIWIHNFGIQNDQSTNFTPRPVYFGRSEFANTIIRPEQASAYVQDKMEFQNLIVNAGLRVDYFRPKAKVLKNPLRLGDPKRLQSVLPEYQVSPRFGLAFPITDRGVLHLSYGHFFQVPNFDLLYLNPQFNLNATQAFQVGNPALKSERTVAYELGVQQQLADDIGLDVTAYYKDVRNLVGTEIFDIGNGNKYSQYVNRDYGNTRGFIVSLERRHSGILGFTIDYTFQI
ncbi:MAG TPA: TonB-dependent receptor, partial [Bacteroidota bacterium]